MTKSNERAGERQQEPEYTAWTAPLGRPSKLPRFDPNDQALIERLRKAHIGSDPESNDRKPHRTPVSAASMLYPVGR